MTVEYGWHFLPQDRQLRYGKADGVLGAGSLRSVNGPQSLCECGLHWSPRIIDAMQYAPGAIVCRVACWGDTIHGDDKAVSRHRQILWWVDAERVLWAWLCDIAEAACADHGVTDERILGAIRLRREWLGGRDVTADELAAASAAARAAASDAASVAAWGAASAAQNESLEAAIRAEAKRLGCHGWDR